MGLKPTPLTIQVSTLPSRPSTPPLPWHPYPRTYDDQIQRPWPLCNCHLQSTLFSTSAHLPCTSVQEICTSTHEGTYLQLNFSNAWLILNIRGIIMLFLNIYFTKEKCSTRWNLIPCLSQSRQVPYHLDHWHQLFLGILIQGLVQIGSEDLSQEIFYFTR